MVKNLTAIQETQFLSLDWEDSLEKGVTTHSSVLTWRTPWTDGPGGLLQVTTLITVSSPPPCMVTVPSCSGSEVPPPWSWPLQGPTIPLK